MNVVRFESRGCQRFRKLLDAYLAGKLSGDERDVVARHLANCASCAQEADGRARLRDSMRRATQRETAPAELQARILNSIRHHENGPRARIVPERWLAAAAAVLVAATGIVGTVSVWRNTDPIATHTALNEATVRNDAVLKVGLGDHVHCALQQPLPAVAPSVDAMRAALGAEYAGLLPLVVERIPPGFRMVEAHVCRFQSRRFVHLIWRSDDTIVSIIVTRKTGEAFDQSAVFAVLDGSGIPVYRLSTQGMEVDGIETADHLAFVISGLPAEKNFQVASNLVAQVRDYLATVEA